MRWSMLPVSVAAHAVIVFTLMILPLAAVDLPTPAPIFGNPEYIVAAAMPEVPEVAPPPSASRPAPQSGAPTSAPERIAPEEDRAVPDVPYVPGALPTDDRFGSTGGPPGTAVGDPPEPPAPPPPPTPQAPLRVGGTVREPRKIVEARPIYPEAARLARIEGLVIIEAVIDERGFVTRTRVLRSRPMLEAAALAALKQWRYTPTLLNNVPVPVIMTITFRFSLDGMP